MYPCTLGGAMKLRSLRIVSVCLVVAAIAVGILVALHRGGPVQAALSPADGHLVFSDPPTDAEFLRCGVFREALVPLSRTRPEENRDLASAVRRYAENQWADAPDEVAPLEQFLHRHPGSPWRA